jgi:hypothetical protein
MGDCLVGKRRTFKRNFWSVSDQQLQFDALCGTKWLRDRVASFFGHRRASQSRFFASALPRPVSLAMLQNVKFGGAAMDSVYSYFLAALSYLGRVG